MTDITPDWSRAPEWAMWYSIDKDGRAQWWKSKPRLDTKYWWWLHDWDAEYPTLKSRMPVERPPAEYGVDWRTTLQQRPAEGKPPTLQEVLLEVSAWQRVQFPHATPASIARHLLKEAQELERAPTDRLEIADVLFLLNALADANGVNLAEVVAEKLAINKARTWGQPDAYGVVEHVEVSDGFAEFESFWPAMPDLQGGRDMFEQYPVSGEPT